MLQGASLARLGAGFAAIALAAAVLGCGPDEPEIGARGRIICEDFEPVRVRLTEELFRPDWEPYYVWVWNKRRTCGFSYRFDAGIGLANGGACVIDLREDPRDWPFEDRLFIRPALLSGTCPDLGQHWHTGIEPPPSFVVVN